ncbi:hypothetical protein HMPREF0742_02194 [Rothia aeria F0184]|uniref:Uncharacterized protein n=1 Tax=Rothia aeria F0184 TaxID=888019 RepID=U7UYN6_9MICC|nr:hypothetical protein HMPREF0742_02194 [Rothia aeria F0184]
MCHYGAVFRRFSALMRLLIPRREYGMRAIGLANLRREPAKKM